MNKIFTLLAAAAVAVPMMTAAEKTVTAELGYKFDSYGTYSKVAELANQKITYDEATDSYTLVDFLGWAGADLTFKLSETTATVDGVVKHPMIIAFENGDATVATDKCKFLPDNEKIINKKHRKFRVNTTDNSAVFTGVVDQNGETNDYRFNGAGFFGCLTELSLSKASSSLGSVAISYAVIDGDNIELTIAGDLGKNDYVTKSLQKTTSGGDWSTYTTYYATTAAVKYNFTKGLVGGGDPEPVEPEGNTTIDLYKAELDFVMLKKYGDKLASQSANISYDEATKQYTVADFLGYKKANLIFSVIEDKTAQLDGKDVNPIRVQLPESSEQEGEFTEWSNIVIEGNNSSMFTFKLSDSRISQENMLDEYWRSAAFIGSDKDYKYINPMFWAVTTNNKSADISDMMAVKACVEKQADGSSIVRILANTQNLMEKAKDAAEWPQESSLTPTGVWITIPADLNAGIEGVETDVVDEDAPVEYYNLQGVKVENPAAGLYIKRQGKKVEKVVIR